MKSLFEAGFFTNNRSNLRRLFKGTAPIVISANGLLQKNGDNTYPFRQDSSFWYFTGIDEPGAILVMDKAKEYIIMPNRHKYADVFDGNIDDNELAERSGIDSILDEDSGWKQLGKKIKSTKHVATIAALPDYVETLGFYPNPARAKNIARMKTYNEDLILLDLRAHITKLRSIKQPEEIQAIKKAIDITRETLKIIKKNIKKYKFEHDVDAFILSEFRKHESQSAFDSVVASGGNAATIHHMHGTSKINDNELLLLDIGAEVENYAADITRTFSINNKPTKRQKQVYDAVQEAQNYAFSIIKAGIIPKKYEEQVEHFMGEQLRVLGLIKTINRDNVRHYFPHLMSHFLGLDTHDIGDYESPYLPNMIVTVEAGLYIPEEGLGVRIEDDIILTDDGYSLLSNDLPSLVN